METDAVHIVHSQKPTDGDHYVRTAGISQGTIESDPLGFGMCEKSKQEIKLGVGHVHSSVRQLRRTRSATVGNGTGWSQTRRTFRN